jgi:hypothetical protein
MNEDQEERLVTAFEQIATALTGIYETEKRQFVKQWPKQKKRREAVYSRVPTDEDRLREEQGASSQPIEKWYSTIDEAEVIGERERAFLAAEAAARAQVASAGGSGEGGAEAPENQPGVAGEDSADQSAV